MCIDAVRFIQLVYDVSDWCTVCLTGVRCITGVQCVLQCVLTIVLFLFPAPDQWTMVPVLVKIYKLLINELSNQIESSMSAANKVMVTRYRGHHTLGSSHTGVTTHWGHHTLGSPHTGVNTHRGSTNIAGHQRAVLVITNTRSIPYPAALYLTSY